jgi:hypothetical protein
MELRTTTFINKDQEIYVLPASSTFTIKHYEIPRLVVFFIKAYLIGQITKIKRSICD